MAEEPRITGEQQTEIIAACTRLDELKDKDEGWTLSYLCANRWKINTIDDMPEAMADQAKVFLTNQIRKEVNANRTTN